MVGENIETDNPAAQRMNPLCECQSDTSQSDDTDRHVRQMLVDRHHLRHNSSALP